ncbi:hypothetical protein ACFLVR_03955 [Chloroflexota bacterium]
MIIEEIAIKSSAILNKLLADQKLSNYTDRTNTNIPRVFTKAKNASDVRLIVIGQDPTIKNEKRRQFITTVLNLDKPKWSLYKYISRICCELGLELEQHVYATNFAKNFFIEPPAQIKECDVLEKVLPYWLPLLQEELSYFPNAKIITLGEPLLKVLSKDKKKAFVNRYWDYNKKWMEEPPIHFSFVDNIDSIINRMFFPFPHQPSIKKDFYNNNFNAYSLFVKNTPI